MSQIEITSSFGSEKARVKAQPGVSRQSRLNQTLMGLLLALVVLSPLPFGSVRGFFWGLSAFYVGLVYAFYLYRLNRLGEVPRVSMRSMRLQVAIFALVCAYLVVQVIPFGQFALVDEGGVVITTPTISIAPDMTLLMLMRQLTYGLFFFLVLQVAANDGRRDAFIKIILISILFYAALGIFNLQSGDTILGLPKWAYLGSATGPFVNRNSFATFLAFGAAIALTQVMMLIDARLSRHRDDGRIKGNTGSLVLYLIGYVFILGVVGATQSRMGLFATISGSLVVLIVAATRYYKAIGALVLLLPVGLVAAGGILLVYGQGLFDRIGSLDQAGGTRADLYSQVLDLIRLRPFTGFGGGTFEMAFPLVHRPPVSSDVVWDRAHNTYLTLWSELGVVAGSVPMILLALFGLKLVLSLRRGQGDWVAQTIALAALVITTVHSLVDFSLEIQANTIVFVALVAAGVATTVRLSRF